MPSTNKVPNLFDISLHWYFHLMVRVVRNADYEEDYPMLRAYYTRKVPVSIRQRLLNYGVTQFQGGLTQLVPILEVALDDTIQQLIIYLPDDGDEVVGGRRRSDAENKASVIWMEEYMSFIGTIDEITPKGLTHLSLAVRFDVRKELSHLPLLNGFLRRPLTQMTLLTHVCLMNICDNGILLILGKNCPSLTHVDMESSWLVTEEGLKALCLKTPKNLTVNAQGREADASNSHGRETEPETPNAHGRETGTPNSHGRETNNGLELDLSKCVLNPCCDKLTFVGVKDTKVGAVGVAVVLLCCPRLESLGGHIYYDNIGGIVCKLTANNPERRFNLQSLWDADLTEAKSMHLAKVLPRVDAVKTHGSHAYSARHFAAVTNITLDFDFRNWTSNVYDLLDCCGDRLRMLKIDDQNHPLDLSLLEVCSALEHIEAKLCGCADPPVVCEQSQDNIETASSNCDLGHVKYDPKSSNCVANHVQPGPESASNGAVNGCESDTHSGDVPFSCGDILFPNLRTALVKTSFVSTVASLVAHSPKLECLEVSLEEIQYGAGTEQLDDSSLSDILFGTTRERNLIESTSESGPGVTRERNCAELTTSLNVHGTTLERNFEYSPSERNTRVRNLRRFVVSSCSALSQHSIDALLSACPHLSYLGNLGRWSLVTKRDAARLLGTILERNWALCFEFRANVYPMGLVTFRNSRTELNRLRDD